MQIEKNHYTINVKGVIQTCTVALYSKSNIFGSVHSKFNQEKFDKWHLNMDSDCKQCPIALICKSGFVRQNIEVISKEHYAIK